MKSFYKALPLGILFLLTVSNENVRSQENHIFGKVVDGTTGKALEYAYIQNYSLKQNIYSNSGGIFQLEAHPGDTLVMYALGYYYQKVVVQDSMLETKRHVEFPLKQQAYHIAEARIIGIANYDDFKRQFVELKMPTTTTEALNNYIADIAHTAAKEAYEEAKAKQHLNGVTFAAVPILTPEEKERIKLAGIIEKEHVRDQIYQKFNPLMVKTITGLTDDDEIIEFMVFCHFSDEYLLEVNEYDLATRIALKFELFKKRKQDKELMKNQINFLDELFTLFA